MSDPAAEIGRRLRGARGRAGVSQAVLASRLQVTQTAVSYWEAGRRLPGIDDLMRLADALGVALADLLPTPAERRSVGAVLRAVGQQVDDKALGEALEKFAEAAALVPVPLGTLTVRAAGARDAAEQLIAEGAPSRILPIDVEQLANLCGVRIMKFDFAQDVDGLLVHLADGPVIGLNIGGGAPLERQRFTMAHELGHYVLRHSTSFHVDFSDVGGSAGDAPGYNWQHERAANEFAAHLLMPSASLRRHAADEQDVGALANQFGVSKQAMSFRLVSLGLRSGPLDQAP